MCAPLLFDGARRREVRGNLLSWLRPSQMVRLASASSDARNTEQGQYAGSTPQPPPNLPLALVRCGEDHQRGVVREVRGVQKDSNDCQLPAYAIPERDQAGDQPQCKQDDSDQEQARGQQRDDGTGDGQPYGAGRPVQSPGPVNRRHVRNYRRLWWWNGARARSVFLSDGQHVSGLQPSLDQGPSRTCLLYTSPSPR